MNCLNGKKWQQLLPRDMHGKPCDGNHAVRMMKSVISDHLHHFVLNYIDYIIIIRGLVVTDWDTGSSQLTL